MLILLNLLNIYLLKFILFIIWGGWGGAKGEGNLLYIFLSFPSNKLILLYSLSLSCPPLCEEGPGRGTSRCPPSIPPWGSPGPCAAANHGGGGRKSIDKGRVKRNEEKRNPSAFAHPAPPPAPSPAVPWAGGTRRRGRRAGQGLCYIRGEPRHRGCRGPPLTGTVSIRDALLCCFWCWVVFCCCKSSAGAAPSP